jgi:hypothetical protein
MMSNGRIEKYFFKEKLRKLLVAINETTVMIQATQNDGDIVAQITFIKNGTINIKAIKFMKLETLFNKG